MEENASKKYESILSGHHGSEGRKEELAKVELEELSNKRPRLSSIQEDS
jgi:hypothetical protein